MGFRFLYRVGRGEIKMSLQFYSDILKPRAGIASFVAEDETKGLVMVSVVGPYQVANQQSNPDRKIQRNMEDDHWFCITVGVSDRLTGGDTPSLVLRFKGPKAWNEDGSESDRPQSIASYLLSLFEGSLSHESRFHNNSLRGTAIDIDVTLWPNEDVERGSTQLAALSICAISGALIRSGLLNPERALFADNIEIEGTPYGALVVLTTQEKLISFRCFGRDIDKSMWGAVKAAVVGTRIIVDKVRECLETT